MKDKNSLAYKGIFGKINAENLLLINVIYHKPTKNTNWCDYLDLILKDVNTGEKKLYTIKDPPMKLYTVKNEFRTFDYYPVCVNIDECDCEMIKMKNLYKEIAKRAGKQAIDYYTECVTNNNRKYLGNLHKWPYVTGSDSNPEDYYRIEWVLHYDNPSINKTLTKQFLDIEVDGINVEGVPVEGVAPINAVSIVDDKTKTVYTFLLYNDKYKDIDGFIENIGDFYEECHESFDSDFGKLEYRCMMHHDEVEMIKSLFRLINTLKRDFVLIWNISYDIPYIIDRLKELGENPIDIMCSKDFEVKELYFIKDRKHFQLKKRKDIFAISSYSIYMDQMLNYVKLRKSGKEIKTAKLNVISEKELGTQKLDYSEEANIKTLPYVNYKMFVLYNIKDTLLQMKIEEKTHDTDSVFQMAYVNGTRYDYIFSETVLLRNRLFIEYYLQSFVFGNNINQTYGDTNYDEEDDNNDTDFEGALVGNSNNIAPVGVEIYGTHSRYIHDDVIDMDFSSMYPSINISHNIGVRSMIGKLILPNFDHINQDLDNVRFDAGREFCEDYITGDRTTLGIKYFNLPTTMQLVDDFEKWKEKNKK